MSDAAPKPTIEQQLSDLFAYKAEWLKGQLFDLFTEPAYFPELATSRPCVLIGGRGTGKTTVLRGLSYEGQHALNPQSSVADWRYYGMYYRVNTNRVTAFQGADLSEPQWISIFGHYINIILCESTLRFLEWYQVNTNDLIAIDSNTCARIAASLNLDNASSLSELSNALSLSRVTFEGQLNNIVDDLHSVRLTLQGAPIDEIISFLSRTPQFKGKQLFFLIDEYENLLDYQQQVVNTLIKHTGELYTFKIGVRELGWRRRITLNPNERLVSPADYVLIDIAEKLKDNAFSKFATTICNERLARLDVAAEHIVEDIRVALPSLTEDEEAIKLGVQTTANEVLEELARSLSPGDLTIAQSLSPLRLYVMKYLAESEAQQIAEQFQEYLASPITWETKFGNYSHSSLFTIRRRKRGISKYYTGWDTFTHLAATNIRYLLELVDRSLLLHIQRGGHLSEGVPPEIQTEAAQTVGKKNLGELEGLSVHGADLTKLLLGLGRVFGIMAQDSSAHTPEVNQFHITNDVVDEKVDELLTSAVMHLALLRFTGNKAADESDTKAYNYRVHPIYAPFFVFSYRRKRKMALSCADLMGLVKEPKKTIRDVLGRSNREPDDFLPAQLMLFEKYFDGGS